MADFYHAIRNTKPETIRILNGIMADGIKSISSGNLVGNESSRMNYDDEICLCRPVSNLLIGSSCLYNFIYCGRVILRVDESITGVFKPTVLSPAEAYELDARGLRGFTEYNDEYRTKDDIPVSKITGLLFPARLLLVSCSIYNYNMYGLFQKGLSLSTRKERLIGTIEYFEEIQEIMKMNGVDIPIFDSENGRQLECPRDIEKIKIFKL